VVTYCHETPDDVGYASVVRHAPLVLDTRNALKDYAAPNVVRL